MFTKRSSEKEWLDLGEDYYSHQEYVHCLKQLFKVNKLFGFFRDTVKTLKNFLPDCTVLDIGCGGGLFLLHLSKYFPQMNLHGMDISKAAINEATHQLNSCKEKQPNIRVTFHLQPHHTLQIAPDSFDIILLTLVCHHLNDFELVDFLKQAYKIARQAIIINDLHRNWLAYWLYAFISPLLFQNKMITHDGLISIKRGFSRKEWHMLLHKADIVNYKIKWCFPFRWKIILCRPSKCLV